MKYKQEEEWQSRVQEEEDQIKHNSMESNQEVIDNIQREWFTVNNLPGLWRKGAAALCKEKAGYAIDRFHHWDTDWIPSGEIVTITAIDMKPEYRKPWGDTDSPIPPPVQPTDGGVVEEWLKRESKEPNWAKEALDKCEKSAAKTMEELQTTGKTKWTLPSWNEDSIEVPDGVKYSAGSGYGGNWYPAHEEEARSKLEKAMTREEIEAELNRIKTYGINVDQEDKSDMEEYLDTIAEKRMIQELEQKLATVTTTDVSGIEEKYQIGVDIWYPQSLEEIIKLIEGRVEEVDLMMPIPGPHGDPQKKLEHVVEQLVWHRKFLEGAVTCIKRAITKGKYICDGERG